MVKEVRTVEVWNRKTKDFSVVTVAISVDIDAIALDLAHKALNNKSGVSRALGGKVVCSLREVKLPSGPTPKPRLVELERMLGWAFNPDKD